MDYQTALNHMPILENRIKLAEQYRTTRSLASEAQYKLEIILASNLSKIRENKSNVGYDMALIMLMEPDFLSFEQTKEVTQYYKDFKKYTAEYKGLERVMSALESKVTFVQSLMRYERENTQ